MPDAGDVYRALAPAVLGYLRAQGAREPEDLLGEVFLQVTRYLPRFRGDESDLRRWVFTIARHRLVDDQRRRARRPQIASTQVPDLEAPPPAGPLDSDLVAALGRLTPEQREVVVLRFVADLSLEEVADVVKRNVGAVKALQHRALATLARILTAAANAREQ